MITDVLDTKRFIRFEILAHAYGEEPDLLPEAFDDMSHAWIRAKQLINTGAYIDVKVVEVITVRTTHEIC